ncbi:phosphotransferase [Brevibacillus sp. AY1]|nr:phosphotransferase [Brevibacillus sp. AY1]
MDKMDLQEICQQYRARVIRVTPLEDYYLLETNRGPKELRVWPRVDVMRWSFAWRERLARQGFRGLERFIRTRESKPFVIVGKRGVTMTDHQRHIEACQSNQEVDRQTGRVIGMMHAAQQESPLLSGLEYLNQEKLKAETAWNRAKALFASYRRSRAGEARGERWVAELMPSLLQRMERSYAMLSHSSISADQIGVSHRDLTRDNWGMVNDKLFIRGFFRPTLSVQLRDVANYLREMHLTHGDFSQVDSFLDGYQEKKPLTYGEYTLLLAFMARPREVWNSVEDYVTRLSHEQQVPTTGIERALESQQSVDQLLRHIADRAERARGEGSRESP